MAARPLVTQEGVLAVDLVPLKVGPDLFEPGPDKVAAVERDMRVLAAPDGQQFAFDVASALEAVVALAERGGIAAPGRFGGNARGETLFQFGSQRRIAQGHVPPCHSRCEVRS